MRDRQRRTDAMEYVWRKHSSVRPSRNRNPNTHYEVPEYAFRMSASPLEDVGVPLAPRTFHAVTL